MPRGSRNLRTRHLLWVVLGFLCCALITLRRDRASRAHAPGRASGPVRLRALPRRPPGRSTSRSAISAAHCLCRGQGLDCPAAETGSILFCILPLHPASACTNCQLLSSSVSKNQESQEALYAHAYAQHSLVRYWCFYFQRCSRLLHAQSNSGSISGSSHRSVGRSRPGSNRHHRKPRQRISPRQHNTDSAGRLSVQQSSLQPLPS